MAGFSPFKRHANKFKYTPRYYDPLKEEFEKRREELRGQRREDNSTSEGEYIPGQYIRTKRMARIAGKADGESRNKKRGTWSVIIIIVLIFLFGSIISPQLTRLFGLGGANSQVEIVEEVEEWNPYRPITVVPNDYKEE